MGSSPTLGTNWGIHILGIMPALHVGQESSILSFSTRLNLGSVIVRKHTDGGTAVESVLGVPRPSINFYLGVMGLR